MNAISVAQLAHYLQVTKRTVQRRARKQNWHYRQQLGLGGTRYVYTFIYLPLDVQNRVVANIVIEHQQLAIKNGIDQLAENPLQVSNWPNNIAPMVERHSKEAIVLQVNAIASSHQFKGAMLDKSQVKQLVLQMADEYCQKHQLGKIKGFDLFCQAYNGGSLGIHEVVYRYVARVSRISLLRWGQQYKRQSDNGVIVITDKDITDVVDQITLIQPKMTAAAIHHYLFLLFKPHQVPSLSRILAYLHGSIEQP